MELMIGQWRKSKGEELQQVKASKTPRHGSAIGGFNPLLDSSHPWCGDPSPAHKKAQARGLKAMSRSVEQSDTTGIHAPTSPTDRKGVEAPSVRPANFPRVRSSVFRPSESEQPTESHLDSKE